MAAQGELDVAERYLTRAASLEGKGRESGGKGAGTVFSWVALMNFLWEKRPASRVADAGVSVAQIMQGRARLRPSIERTTIADNGSQAFLQPDFTP